jgi:hypothetical protein
MKLQHSVRTPFEDDEKVNKLACSAASAAITHKSVAMA